jgi:hypothetical protein
MDCVMDWALPRGPDHARKVSWLSRPSSTITGILSATTMLVLVSGVSDVMPHMSSLHILHGVLDIAQVIFWNPPLGTVHGVLVWSNAVLAM